MPFSRISYTNGTHVSCSYAFAEMGTSSRCGSIFEAIWNSLTPSSKRSLPKSGYTTATSMSLSSWHAPAAREPYKIIFSTRIPSFSSAVWKALNFSNIFFQPWEYPFNLIKILFCKFPGASLLSPLSRNPWINKFLDIMSKTGTIIWNWNTTVRKS